MSYKTNTNELEYKEEDSTNTEELWYKIQMNTRVSQSERGRKIVGGVQVTISTITLIGLTILILSILSSKQTRSQSFNIYLVYLQTVDAILNLSLITATIFYWQQSNDIYDDNDPDDRNQQHETNQYFWSITESVVIFATVANMWLNAIIAYQIYKLLRNSFMVRRTEPPTVKRIFFQSLIVYAVAICVASLHFWDHQQNSDNTDSAAAEEWAPALIFGPIIPFLYILYVSVRIYQTKLLRLSDQRTRVMAIYFGRIVLVFLCFYIPGTTFFLIGVINYIEWARSVGNLLFSLQGTFSLAVALMKPDVRNAVRVFIRCRYDNGWLSCCQKRTDDIKENEITIIDNKRALYYPDNGVIHKDDQEQQQMNTRTTMTIRTTMTMTGKTINNDYAMYNSTNEVDDDEHQVEETSQSSSSPFDKEAAVDEEQDQHQEEAQRQLR